ncbi:MAG: hypothetical protein FWE88_03015 [Phycisphaerae bacterium]|nr:hypothetical protein [Phycisphaerae bacterium]
MTTIYTPQWANANSAGLVDSSRYIRRCDLDELAAAINRRRLLVIQNPYEYGPLLDARPYVSQYAIDDSSEMSAQDHYAMAMRHAVINRILYAQPGRDTLHQPASPKSITWLWPLADADENKAITTWLASPSSTAVGLFNRLNGSATWTQPTLHANGVDYAKAVHVNELRQALEWLRRGRWELPIYWNLGMLSEVPDTGWFGDSIANTGSGELRSLGLLRAVLLASEIGGGMAPNVYGLHGVRVLSASISIAVNTACVVELRQVLRPISLVRTAGDLPTWNHYRGTSKLAWAQPGGMGAGDSVAIGGGATSASPGSPAVFSGGDLLPVLQAMFDQEAGQFFLLRRVDVANTMVDITGTTLTVDFELTSPPA